MAELLTYYYISFLHTRCRVISLMKTLKKMVILELLLWMLSLRKINLVT